MVTSLSLWTTTTTTTTTMSTRRINKGIWVAGIFFLTISQLLRMRTQQANDFLRHLQDIVPSVVSNHKMEGIQWKNRNYMIHPVTETESNYISNMTIDNAERMKNQTKVLKVAICHPTMFGDILLDTHFAWVSYYRLLGFDHIFLWYEETISTLPRFDELAALPYVTLTLHISRGNKEKYHGQDTVEKACFAMAKDAMFDWALAIDVDEYIWFQKHQSIQEFLTQYEQQGLTYISLGKHHYSTRHIMYNGSSNTAMTTTTSSSSLEQQQQLVGAVAPEDANAGASFGLEQYPFTPGPYCYGNKGSSHCPTWTGRCKVLAKPSKFSSGVQIHGIGHHNAPDGIHLDTSVAHFKEWVGLTPRRRRDHDDAQQLGRTSQNENDSVVYHNNTSSFTSSAADDAGIYWLVESHTVNATTGMVTLYHDGDKLHDWFQFVARGAVTSQQDSAATLLS